MGEDVLVTGAGPIGIMAAAVARHVGARHVVITDINAYRLELAGRVADVVPVNVATEELPSVMQRLGMREGFDIGLEMSGAEAALNQMLDTILVGGKIAMLGIPARPFPVDWTKIVFHMLTIKGIYGREMFETWHKMIAMLQSGLDIRSIITHRFPAADFATAFDIMAKGESGKVVLDWSHACDCIPSSRSACRSEISRCSSLVCALWGFNMVASKIVVGDLGVPPLFYAAARSAVVALAVAPWLLPAPRPLWRVFLVGILMGGGGFGLIFIGLQWATPSAAAVVIQLSVPMVTVLSVVMLGERIRWRRGLGIALAIGGVVLVMWDPNGFQLSSGLLFVAAGAFCGALGAIMIKQMGGISPLRFQAWVGFSSVLVSIPLSVAFEHDQLARAFEAGWPFVGLLLYSALAVSVFAHTMLLRADPALRGQPDRAFDADVAAHVDRLRHLDYRRPFRPAHGARHGGGAGRRPHRRRQAERHHGQGNLS